MKHLSNKYYTAFFCLCSNIMLFAQPGSGSDTDDLEGTDTPMPIDDYIWVLALIGLLFVFLKLKDIQAKKMALEPSQKNIFL